MNVIEPDMRPLSNELPSRDELQKSTALEVYLKYLI